MKTRLTFLFLSAGIVSACSSAVTPEKMARVHAGMKTSEVEVLLGRPAHIDQSETTGLRGEVYDYPGANGGEGRVVLLNDTVFKVEFVPGGGKS
jgi:hypothetical protein